MVFRGLPFGFSGPGSGLLLPRGAGMGAVGTALGGCAAGDGVPVGLSPCADTAPSAGSRCKELYVLLRQRLV